MKTRSVLLGCAVVLSSVGLLSSCSDDSVSPGGPSGPSWVAWRNPNVFSYSYGLNAIWGNSSRDLYAVGQGGMIIRYDGREWTLVRYGKEPDLTDVWGSSARDVFAVGHEGAILHYDGKRWVRMASGTAVRLNAVWGRASYDVYAVGEAGTVLHFDGREWSSMGSGTDRTLTGVWGIGDWAFAVGDGGTVLRLTPWDARPVYIATTNPLYGIGGTSPTGLYAVGAAGTVLRYNGSSWQPVRSGTTRGLSNVCGTQDGHVIVTAGSKLLHYDGRDWELMDAAPEGWGFVDAWGLSMRSLFLLGTEAVWHYDGSAWSAIELPELRGDDPGQSLVDMWGSSGNAIYAVGQAGTVLKYDGTDWTSTTAGLSDLETVWGLPESQLFAVSTTIDDPPHCREPPCPERQIFSSIFSSDGTTWSEMNVIKDKSIASIWGNSEDCLFGVGSFLVFVEEETLGTIHGWLEHYRAIVRYDGSTWSPMIDETTPGRLNDVWGSSEDNVFAVGSEGAILHYDGAVWTAMTSETTEDINAVWGASANDVVAVGASGVILRFDGHAWLPIGGGTTQTLYGVWGNATDDVFAVGEGGTILHFDGSGWTAMPSPTKNTLYAVWGAGPHDVFAVGQYGTICHYGLR